MPNSVTEWNQYLYCNAGWPIRRKPTEVELDGNTVRFLHFQRWLKTSTIERPMADVQSIRAWNCGVIVDRIGLMIRFKDGSILRTVEGIRGYDEFVRALIAQGFIDEVAYNEFDRTSECGDGIECSGKLLG